MRDPLTRIMYEKLKILSANCRGLQDRKKRTDVLNYYKEKKPNILCLQDTHLIDKDLSSIKDIWGHEAILNGTRSNARGVAILLNNNFEYTILNIHRDNDGNLSFV